MKKITKNRGITLLGALLCVSSLSFGGTSSGSKKITGDFKGPCPTITITITSQTNALCNGLNDGSVTVSASGGAVPYTYSWNTKPVQTGDTASSLAAGNYKVYVTDSNGCKDSSVITITQPPALVLSATAYSATCYGACNGAIDFSVTGGTGSDTYELNGSSWSGEPPIGGLCAGSQLLSVTDSNGCTADTTIMIAQPTAVIATAKASPDDICAGSSSVISATATGGTSPYKYSWSSGCHSSSCTVTPSVTTTYTLTADDANSCSSAPVTVTVNVNPPINIVASPNHATCPGGSVTLTAVASGGDGTFSYTWQPGGLSGPSIVVSPAATTVYTVTVKDGCGTSPAIDTVEAIVDPLPVVDFIADTANGCSPLCVNFSDSSTLASGGIASWSWNFGDGNTSTSQNPFNCYSNAGKYTVSLSVTSDSGCVSSRTVSNYISVYSNPVANFTISPSNPTGPNPIVHFIDSSVDAYGITSWFWTFGDISDSTSALENPEHTYGDTGIFCPMLIVTNIHGCSDSVTNCFEVYAEGINELQNNKSFKLYPVPTSDNLNISITGSGFNPQSLMVYDITGRKLMNEKISADRTINTIDVSNLENGTYLLMLSDGDNRQMARFTVVK